MKSKTPSSMTISRCVVRTQIQAGRNLTPTSLATWDCTVGCKP